MTLDQIICFLETAKCLNFTKASQSLHVTQQGLSHTIFTLEKELDLQLFNRTTRNVELTQEGKLLFEEWSEIPNTIQKSIKQAKMLNNKIRIGIVEMQGIVEYLESLMEELYENFPEIEFEFCSVGHGNKLLVDKQIDMIITLSFTFDKMKEGYHYYIFKETPICFILSKKHKLAKRTDINKNDISDEYFFIYQKDFEPDAEQKTLITCFGKEFAPKKFINYSNINSMELDLIAGKGIYIGYSELFRNKDKLVKIPIPRCEGWDSVYLVAAWRANHEKKLKKIINLLNTYR